LSGGTRASPPLWRLLQEASKAVQAVMAGQSLTAVLEATPSTWRAGAQALSFEAMRRLGRAQALRELLAPRRPPAAVDALLCTTLALTDPDAGSPYPMHTLIHQAVEAARRQRSTRSSADFINACLRRVQREADKLTGELPAQGPSRWNHPHWWVERLQNDHPHDWSQVLQAAQSHAFMTLRVNRLHHRRGDYLALLLARGIEARAVGEDGVQLAQTMPVHLLPGFSQGHVSVQDAAAQLAAPLLLEGLARPKPWRVLDACAAPGGKTGHLLECAPQAQVLALDVDPMRCDRIHDNLTRLGLSARVLAADAGQPARWWDGQPFDAILLDAPCTASGIGRRHPDVRWLRRPTDVHQLADVQQRLLQVLWPLLAPGGRLLYCTCSVFKAEGADTIQAFLARNTDAVLLPSPGHLLPRAAAGEASLMDNPLGEHDGFFYALLARRD
jgi:16S rRNA (cytosine967-C5)-methyltransferase